MEVGGAFVAPAFADAAARQAAFDTKGAKLTDFNDLAALEGLHVVRTQLETRLTALAWRLGAKAAPTPQGGGCAAKNPLKPIETVDELLERYALIYGQGGTVFDHQEHCLLPLGDMRDVCMGRFIHREWSDHPDRQIARIENVGFDPACTDKDIHCNLWSGWPTTPVAGNCESLVDLLRYMCAGDSKPEELFQWVIKWLAYPIQHPGAKMQTTIVVHGPQGTGKNMFFEVIMGIYGRYGRIIDQSAIEDKFNDWASRRLFLIADEVVARSDLYHVKNKLKAFITGEWIRINPKNMAAYDERNHVNMVFLSNEAMPTIVEQDDRRHAVIWTPEKLSADFYAGLKREIDNGGGAALHHYLLHLDLGDFGPASKPPMTDAKRELIDQSLDSPSRFVLAFERGDVEGFPGKGAPKLLTPCLSQDFYELYGEWCRRQGLKSLNMPKFMNAVDRKHQGITDRKRIGQGSNPKTVLYLPGGHEKPPAQNEADWLEDRVDIFKTAFKDYKATTGGFA
jgi:putative DNA primase/helicase